MKKLMFIFFIYSIPLFSQTNLNLGDIAFTGYQSEKGDKFAFVLLTNITSGTEITFTDQGWLSSGGFFQDEPENTIFWISNSSLAYGTQIIIQIIEDADENKTLSTSHGNVSGDTFGLSDSGDQIFAYQGERPTASEESNFLAAIQMNGEWNSDATNTKKSAKPDSFTDGVNSLYIIDQDGDEVDNAVYNCSIKSSNTGALRNAVNNSANWILSDDFEANPIAIPYCAEPLPVELTMFNANVIENSVKLNWETATEVNNYGFDIEKKKSEISSKELVWEKIGFVEGHGNSNSPKYYSYSDNLLESSGEYSYRLKQVDIDGTFEYSDVVEANLGLPKKIRLDQNYPNPFNPSTSISYSIPSDGHVTLAIYDVLGNSVAVLENGFKSARSYSQSFDASNLTSGIYFYTIRSGKFVETKKMLLMK